MKVTVSKENVSQFIEKIKAYVEKHGLVSATIEKHESIGKWGMSRLWRKWMSQTADFMAKNGVTMPLMIDKSGRHYGSRPFNAEDAHELFTSQWLGVDKNGSRLSWAKSDHDGMKAATKGERFLAMQRHQSWCIEKGIDLFIPADSEFMELEKEQNE